MTTGIYCIKCKVNEKVYIGSSKVIEQRFHEHRSCLRRNKHPNGHLQNAWNLYQEGNFEFSILEETKVENKLEREQWYLDSYGLPNPDKGYNLRVKAESNHEMKFASPETKAKLSIAAKMMNAAIAAKTNKIDKKLKMIDLQLKKLAIDKRHGNDTGEEVQGEGYILTDRNSILEKLKNLK